MRHLPGCERAVGAIGQGHLDEQPVAADEVEQHLARLDGSARGGVPLPDQKLVRRGEGVANTLSLRRLLGGKGGGQRRLARFRLCQALRQQATLEQDSVALLHRVGNVVLAVTQLHAGQGGGELDLESGDPGRERLGRRFCAAERRLGRLDAHGGDMALREQGSDMGEIGAREIDRGKRACVFRPRLGKFGGEPGAGRLRMRPRTLSESAVMRVQLFEAAPRLSRLGAHEREVMREPIELAVLLHEASDDRPRLPGGEHDARGRQPLVGEPVDRRDDPDHLGVDHRDVRDPVGEVWDEGVAGSAEQADAEKHAVETPGEHGLASRWGPLTSGSRVNRSLTRQPDRCFLRAMSPPWAPDRLAARLPFLRRRARLVADIRSFFAARGYTEVETPVLQPCPGMEPNLEPFATRYVARLGGETRALFLQFSPEFAMKKLIAGGAGPIFQFARVFRNGEAGPFHQPEFILLEWYRPGLSLEGLMDETEALIRAVVPEGLRTPRLLVPTDLPFERITVAEAFLRYCDGLDILATAPDPLAPDIDLLAEAAARIGVSRRPGDTWQDLFFRLLLGRIEPAIGRDRPAFLTHWPASEAALSRRDPADPRVALRFELFAAGLELANAYEELTDPAEQRARFSAWAEERRRIAGEERAVDEDFLAALEHGLPPCSGIALGLDRLAMLASGAARIEDVLWLPIV